MLDLGLPHLVAERDGRVLGYAYAGKWRPRPAYNFSVEDSIYIDKDAVGQGVGKALLPVLIEQCTALGKRQMVAVIGDSAQTPSIRLHASCGFEMVGTLKSIGFKFGRWLDSVLMQRALGVGDADDRRQLRSAADMRLIDYFDRGADLFPQRDCLHDGTRGWTYADVRGTTHRVANGLLAAGLKRGDKVAVYSPNHAMAYAALLGIQRAGLIWAPVNARNAIEENLYILDNTDVAFLFYHSSFEDSLPRIREACPKIRTSSASTRRSSPTGWRAFDGAAPDLADDAGRGRDPRSARAARPDGPRACRSPTA